MPLRIYDEITHPPNAPLLPSISRESDICLGLGSPMSLFQQAHVGTGGFEPPTSVLSGRRSDQLSYAPLWHGMLLVPSSE